MLQTEGALIVPHLVSVTVININMKLSLHESDHDCHRKRHHVEFRSVASAA